MLENCKHFVNLSIYDGLPYTPAYCQWGQDMYHGNACMLTSFLYLLQGKRKYLDTLHKYLEIHGTFFGVKVVVLLLSSIYYSKQQTNKEMTANKTNKFDCAIGPDPERTVSIK